MTINVIHRDNNITLLTQTNPSTYQLTLLPSKDQIIEYNDKRYVVKQVIKTYTTIRRMALEFIEITNIDIIVADDMTGRCW